MAPSLGQFAEHRRLIISSTPNGEGEFQRQFDMALAAQDRGESVVVFQRPTWDCNPVLPAGLYDEERIALGGQFDGEYGAEFLASGSALLSDEEIRSCVVTGGDLSPHEGVGWVCGADFAWRRDRSAAVIVGYDPDQPTVLRVGAIRTWEPAQDLSEGTEGHQQMVLRQVAQLAHAYGATIYCDPHESVTVKDKLERLGSHAQMVPTGAGVKGLLYRELASKVRLQQISYPDHPLLIGELRRLKVKYTGPSMTVENPRAQGGHGDVANGLAMATYQLRREGGSGAMPDLDRMRRARPISAGAMAIDAEPRAGVPRPDVDRHQYDRPPPGWGDGGESIARRQF
jgi:hypothetical protein